MLFCSKCQQSYEGEIGQTSFLSPCCREILLPQSVLDRNNEIHLLFSPESLQPFLKGPTQLYERINKITPIRLWPLAVVGEIIYFEAEYLSEKLNFTPPPRVSFFWGSEQKEWEYSYQQWHKLWKSLEEFYQLLIHTIGYYGLIGNMKELFNFYEKTNHHILQWLDITTCLVDYPLHMDSPSWKLRDIMLNLLYNLQISLLNLAHILRKKSKLTLAQLRISPIDISLVRSIFWQVYHLIKEQENKIKR